MKFINIEKLATYIYKTGSVREETALHLLDMIQERDNAIKKLQSIAKYGLDELPTRWKVGYDAGLRDSGKCWEEAKAYGDKQKKMREDENFNFTEEIMELEAKIEKLEGKLNGN